MFHWGADEPDFENPAYWQRKIERAQKIRKEIITSPGTNGYRLPHAEGDFLPGLIADVYNEVSVLQVLIKGVEQRLSLFTEAFHNLGYGHLFVKAKNSSPKINDINSGSHWIDVPYGKEIIILENGLKFSIDVEGGQKTGFFLDQRDNRQLLRTLAKDKTVLNAFSYTGGFSVYALAGGAKMVHSADISNDAINASLLNIELNFPDAAHEGFVVDCFDFLKDMPDDLYDLIVLDPPAFAKHARSVENATRGYKQINLQAFKKIKPGGLLFTFSCSQHISSDLFQKIIFGAAADSGRNVRILYQLQQPADHPINIYHPEGEYLKGLVLWVE
jgi:23S rRNA (cytosine1962-C5)-methyltransferase